MSEQNRPTISANRIREGVGVTIRGTGTTVAMTGAFLMAAGFILPEPAMANGLHKGLTILFGGAATLTGGAMRYVGGLIMDRKGPQ